jgi:pyruvate dehydrogenase E1 component
MNESYAHPSIDLLKAQEVLSGCYLLSPAKKASKKRVTLMGSGAITLEVLKAKEQLKEKGVEADVFSVTSWSELDREALANDDSFLAAQLALSKGPIVAASDYVRAVPERLRAHIPPGRTYATLGTDGFGRSDTRSELRRYFGVDAQSIAQLALSQLDDSW